MVTGVGIMYSFFAHICHTWAQKAVIAGAALVFLSPCVSLGFFTWHLLPQSKAFNNITSEVPECYSNCIVLTKQVTKVGSASRDEESDHLIGGVSENWQLFLIHRGYSSYLGVFVKIELIFVKCLEQCVALSNVVQF